MLRKSIGEPLLEHLLLLHKETQHNFLYIFYIIYLQIYIFIFNLFFTLYITFL